MTLENGTWLMVKSKQGVFLQARSQLDLSHDVTLYRDDGTTMTTASASVDLKNGAAASADRPMPKVRSARSTRTASPSPTKAPRSSSPARRTWC